MVVVVVGGGVDSVVVVVVVDVDEGVYVEVEVLVEPPEPLALSDMHHPPLSDIQ